MNDGRKGGTHRNMTRDAETEFLEQFKNVSEADQVITISDIRTAYDKKKGKPSATSTAYILLQRHGWRKAMPRSQHPQRADEAGIKALKN